jgi:hypothetical protein
MSAALVDLVKSTGDLLSEQSKILGAVNMSEFMNAQATQLMAKLDMLPDLTADTAKSFTAAIAAGPWDDSSKVRLAKAVCTRMMSPTKKQKHAKTPTQTMSTFQLYLKPSHVSFMQDKNVPFPLKLVKAAELMHALRCDFPSCPTCGHVVTVVRNLDGGPKLTGTASYDTVNQFKSYLKNLLKGDTLPEYDYELIEHYPSSPHDLHSALFGLVYTDEAPNEHVWDGVSMANVQVLRKNHKSLKPDSCTAAMGLLHGQTMQDANCMNPQMNPMMRAMMNPMMQTAMMHQMMNPAMMQAMMQGSEPSGVDLSVFRFPKRPRMLDEFSGAGSSGISRVSVGGPAAWAGAGIDNGSVDKQPAILDGNAGSDSAHGAAGSGTGGAGSATGGDRVRSMFSQDELDAESVDGVMAEAMRAREEAAAIKRALDAANAAKGEGAKGKGNKGGGGRGGVAKGKGLVKGKGAKGKGKGVVKGKGGKGKAVAKAKAKAKASAKGKGRGGVGGGVIVGGARMMPPGYPADQETRVRMRPHGCSKCRNKAGCTPSCWREHAR